MDRNVKIARRLVAVARMLMAEDGDDEWGWNRFCKKHSDVSCFIEGKGSKLEVYYCLSDIPKTIIHRNGTYFVQGCETKGKEFHSLAEALGYIEKHM